MTTVIYNAPPKAMSYAQTEILRKVFGEESTWLDWTPGQSIPSDHLIITAEGIEKFKNIMAEEDLVNFDEAAEAYLAELNPVSDIIHPEDSPEPKLTVEDALMVLGMTIKEALQEDGTPEYVKEALQEDDTPEYIKADLRCLQQLVTALEAAYPFTPEDDLSDLPARKHKCITELRELVKKNMTIFQDTIEGKFHEQRGKS